MNMKSIIVGEPKKYPKELVDALVDFFKQSPEVESAYLAQIFDPSSGRPPYLSVGIVMSAEIQTIAKGLKNIVETQCDKSEFIDFHQLISKGEKGIFSSFKPFYEFSSK